MADPDPKENTVESLFNRHLVEPTKGEDGLGPTVGEDVGADAERREDARHGAHSKDAGSGI